MGLCADVGVWGRGGCNADGCRNDGFGDTESNGEGPHGESEPAEGESGGGGLLSGSYITITVLGSANGEQAKFASVCREKDAHGTIIYDHQPLKLDGRYRHIE